MNNILITLLFIISLGTQAQYIEQVRKAELYFVRNEVQEASAIYNKLFDSDRKAMLSQDCLNAAYCEMKLTGFLGAQRFLNLLAVRNVPFDVIEEYSEIKGRVDDISWENFRSVYAQLYESSIPNNDYTVFEEEFISAYKQCSILFYQIPLLPVFAVSGNDGVIIYDGELIYKGSLKQKDTILVRGQSLLDSLLMLPDYQKPYKDYKEACNELYNEYVNFFSIHVWPRESELKSVALFSKKATRLLQYVGFWLELEDPFSFSVEEGGNGSTNRVYSTEQRSTVLKPITEAIEMEKVKPIHVFRSLHPWFSSNIILGHSFITLTVEEDNCSYNGKHFLKPVSKDFDFEFYAVEYNIESREQLLEKSIWSHLSEESFSLNVHFQKELSTYPTCKLAEQFIKENKLTEALPLTE